MAKEKPHKARALQPGEQDNVFCPICGRTCRAQLTEKIMKSWRVRCLMC